MFKEYKKNLCSSYTVNISVVFSYTSSSYTVFINIFIIAMPVGKNKNGKTLRKGRKIVITNIYYL